MASCAVTVGAHPAPLSIRVMAGEPAAIVIPAEGVLSAPVIEWAGPSGAVAETHALTLAGVDGDLNLWSLALTAEQTTALAAAGVTHARMAETSPRRQPDMAGRVHWLHGWSGMCETTTAPLVVVGIPGPAGPGVDADGATAGQVPTADGAGDWSWADPAGGSGGPVDWGDVQNTPSEFPPEAHTHEIPDVDGLQDALDAKQAAGSYATAAQGGKADTASQPGHGHVLADISDYAAPDLSGLVEDDDPRLSDARTPVAHSHAQSDVTGLADALAAKADTDDLAGLVTDDDPRLTDARTPTSHSHTAATINSGGATNGQALTADGDGGATWQTITEGGVGGTSVLHHVAVQTGNETRPDAAVVLWIGGDTQPANMAVGDVWLQAEPVDLGTPPAITTATLGTIQEDAAYSLQLAATGDVPIAWTISAGALPAGLSLSSGGLVSGTPTTPGAYDVTVEATNNAGSDTQQYTGTVTAADAPIPPTITTTTLTTVRVGSVVSQQLAATGDTPITWAVTAGTLPDGLTLSNSGLLSGTPTTEGAYDFTATATNAGGTDDQQYTGVVEEESTAALIQVNSGVFEGGEFTATLPAPATGLVIIALAGNGTVTTPPPGLTQRSATVNYMGNYLWDGPGDGDASWTGDSGSDRGAWMAMELTAGAAFLAAETNPPTGDTGDVWSTTHTSPTVTPTAGKRGILSAIRSLLYEINPASAAHSGWAAGWDEIADQSTTAGDRPAQGCGWIEVTADGSTAYASGTIATGRASTGQSGLTAVYSLP